MNEITDEQVTALAGLDAESPSLATRLARALLSCRRERVTDVGLERLAKEHASTMLASCETALEERDASLDDAHAEVARLRAALEPFAREAERVDAQFTAQFTNSAEVPVAMGNLRAARAALASPERRSDAAAE